jgi:DNA-binding NarL/FixJ family response regulator
VSDGRGVPLYVLPSQAAAAAVLRRLDRAGWAVRDGFVLPSEPWDLRSGRLVVSGDVRDVDDVPAAVLAAARGAGVVVVADPAKPAGRDLVADLSRIGTVRTDPGAAAPEPEGSGDGPELTVEQRALLDRLADGESIAGAAEAEFLSLRTANRRIAAARKALGARSTREAVVEYVRRRTTG